MEFDKSQLMRGTLEGCILKIISNRTTYGYEIMVSLRDGGFGDISEGTIYPILLRLEKQGIVSAVFRPSPLGPQRKYYTISDSGKIYLQSFEDYWDELTQTVGGLLKREDGKEHG